MSLVKKTLANAPNIIMVIKSRDMTRRRSKKRGKKVQPLYTKFCCRVVIFEQLLYLITYFAGQLLVLIKALPNKA